VTLKPLGAVGFAALFTWSSLSGANTLPYRGFQIDDSRVAGMQNLEEVRAAIKEQIDIVWAVGLPAGIITFFQTVQMKVVPIGAMGTISPGLYIAQDKEIRITAGLAPQRNKPILLHELLHAFHDQRIHGGYGNEDIRAFFQLAEQISAYAPKSHMMSNQVEFFACSATTYLNGVTAQEPFKREKVRDCQPLFYAYLASIFGPKAGSYQGSLERAPAASQ
jgi:hypothetical protein